MVYDVSNKGTFKEVYPGVPGGNQWLNALKENVDHSLLAAVMLVENKIDKLSSNERPLGFVQKEEVDRVLMESVFKEPKSDLPANGHGWLYNGPPSETVPYRIANSLMFARTSAVTNKCELFELTEKASGIADVLKRGTAPSVEYEQTLGVTTVSQALEALVLRIYARSQHIDVGGSKPSGKAFKVIGVPDHDAPKNSCC